MVGNGKAIGGLQGSGSGGREGRRQTAWLQKGVQSKSGVAKSYSGTRVS